jgi:hypothetical protein
MAIQKFITLENRKQRLIDGGIQSSLKSLSEGKLIALNNNGEIDDSFFSEERSNSTQFITSERIKKGSFVHIWDNNGTANIRNANAVAGNEANGFVLEPYDAGDLATFYFKGVNTAVTGVTIGKLFLSVAPGEYSGTAPYQSGNIVQKLGIGISSTSINFEFTNPIELA